MFPLHNIPTTTFFDYPVNLEDIGAIGRAMFNVRKRIEIKTLHPRQSEVSGSTLNYKIKGNGYTVPFVALGKTGNILIDGHHTVISKKLRGQKFIYALVYQI